MWSSSVSCSSLLRFDGFLAYLNESVLFCELKKKLKPIYLYITLHIKSSQPINQTTKYNRHSFLPPKKYQVGVKLKYYSKTKTTTTKRFIRSISTILIRSCSVSFALRRSSSEDEACGTVRTETHTLIAAVHINTHNKKEMLLKVNRIEC